MTIQLDDTALNIERTIMANERTLLSWTRTAFALLAIGILVAKLDLSVKHSHNRMLGALVSFSAILMMLVGILRYNSLNRNLKHKVSVDVIITYSLSGIIMLILTYVLLRVSSTV